MTKGPLRHHSISHTPKVFIIRMDSMWVVWAEGRGPLGVLIVIFGFDKHGCNKSVLPLLLLLPIPGDFLLLTEMTGYLFYSWGPQIDQV